MRPTAIQADKARRVLTISWDDGEKTEHGFYDLAAGCHCATCNDRRARLKAEGKPFVPESSELLAIEAVGSYGISIVWQDGCRYGIFTWEYLRELASGAPADHPSANHSAW